MKIILFLLSVALLTNISVAHDWIKVELPEGKETGDTFVFVGLEESPQLQEKLGKWLPKGLIKLSPGSDSYSWKLEQVTREENHTSVTFLISDSKGEEYSMIFKRFHKGPKGKVNVKDQEVKSEEKDSGDQFVEIGNEGDEKTLTVLVTSGTSIEELKDRINISKASPVWKWETFTDLGTLRK